ncbi:unnamed protein product, partial [Meganyctiphanes norvegica]
MIELHLYITLIYFTLIHSQIEGRGYITVSWIHIWGGHYLSLTLSTQTHPSLGVGMPIIASPVAMASNCNWECTDHDKTAFECLKGFKGGKLMTRHEDIYCTFHGPYSPEWHGFLCMKYDNNPYIGHFFSIFPIIKNIEIYVSKINSPKYSYEEKNGEVKTTPSQSNYVIGSVIEITNDDDNKLLKGYLSLPQTFLNEYCMESYPIKFLKKMSHICPLALTPDSCINAKRLNSNYYLHSSNKIPSFFNHNFKTNSSDNQFANVSVEHFCQNNIGNYVKVQGLNTVSLREKSEFYSFINNASMVNCNGSRSPIYNETLNLCENVVLDVQYSMFWSGPSIDKVFAKIIMGNIPVSFSNTKTKIKPKWKGSMKKELNQNKKGTFEITLLQHFNVDFSHLESTNKSSENITELEADNTKEDNVYLGKNKPTINLLLKSGGPGYIVQKPLIAGYTQYRNITQPKYILEFDKELKNISTEDKELKNISTEEVKEINMVFFDNSTILYNKSMENGIFSMEQIEEILLYNGSDINSTFSGEINENRTEKKFHYVDFPYDSGLFTIKSVSDCDCRNSSLVPIRFGIDSNSGCKFHFQVQNDSSCSKTKSGLYEVNIPYLHNMQNPGWPNSDQAQNFRNAHIGYRENKHDKIPMYHGCELPTSLEFTFVYQDVANFKMYSKLHSPIYQIMAASLRIHYSWYELRKQSSSHVQFTISSTFIEKHKTSQISRLKMDFLSPWIDPKFWHFRFDTVDSLAWSSAARYSEEVISLRLHHIIENTTQILRLYSNSIAIILLVIPFLLLTLNQNYRIKL